MIEAASPTATCGGDPTGIVASGMAEQVKAVLISRGRRSVADVRVVVKPCHKWGVPGVGPALSADNHMPAFLG